MPSGHSTIGELLSEGVEAFKKNINSVVPLFVGAQASIFLITYLTRLEWLNILMIPVVMLTQVALLKSYKSPVDKFDYEKMLDLKDPELKQKLIDLFITYLMFIVLLVILFLLLIIPGIIFMVYWYVFPYIVLDQRLKGWDALKKSKEMITGHWWKTFALLLIAGIAGGVISSIISSIAGQDALIGGFLMAIISGIMSIYFGYVAVAYYFDLKK